MAGVELENISLPRRHATTDVLTVCQSVSLNSVNALLGKAFTALGGRLFEAIPHEGLLNYCIIEVFLAGLLVLAANLILVGHRSMGEDQRLTIDSGHFE